MDQVITPKTEDLVEALNQHAGAIATDYAHDLELRVALHQAAIEFKLIEVKRTHTECIYQAPNGVLVCSCYCHGTHHIGEDGYHFAILHTQNRTHITRPPVQQDAEPGY